jgi:hypothetical protein
MAKPTLLAFLLCDSATKDPAGKVTLHGVFDRIIAPRDPGNIRLYFAYYRVIVEAPCAISMKVVDPEGHETSRDWHESITGAGTMQTIWGVPGTVLRQPGRYLLELTWTDANSNSLSLVKMPLTVEIAKDRSR